MKCNSPSSCLPLSPKYEMCLVLWDVDDEASEGSEGGDDESTGNLWLAAGLFLTAS